jgi:hypothetical protein
VVQAASQGWRVVIEGGAAHCLVSAELCEWLYAQPVFSTGVVIRSDVQFDDEGTRILRVISDKLRPGYHGMQSLIVEGHKVRFARDVDV